MGVSKDRILSSYSVGNGQRYHHVATKVVSAWDLAQDADKTGYICKVITVKLLQLQLYIYIYTYIYFALHTISYVLCYTYINITICLSAFSNNAYYEAPWTPRLTVQTTHWVEPCLSNTQPVWTLRTPRPCFTQQYDIEAKLAANGMAAFKCKLRCHWLKRLHQCHTVIQKSNGDQLRLGIKQCMMPTPSIFLYYLSDFFSMNDFS